MRSTRRSQLVPSTADVGKISRNGYASRARSISGSIRAFGDTRSALLRRQNTGPRYVRSGSSTSRSVSPMASDFAAASTTRPTTSTSSTARCAVSSMRAPSRPPPACNPGVSTKTIWASRRFLIPVMRVRVVWGRGETIASFSPTRRLSNVDFPAFGRPISDTNPERIVTVAPASGWRRRDAMASSLDARGRTTGARALDHLAARGSAVRADASGALPRGPDRPTRPDATRRA